MSRNRLQVLTLLATLAVFGVSCGGTTARTITLASAGNGSSDAKSELASDAPLIYGAQPTYEWGGGAKPAPETAVQAWTFSAPKDPTSQLGTVADALFGRHVKITHTSGEAGSHTAGPVDGASFISYGDENARWWSFSRDSMVGPGASSSSGCAPDNKNPENTKCGEWTVTTMPPVQGLLTEQEATARVNAILGKISSAGITAPVDITTSKDSQATNVSAMFRWNDQTTLMNWYFSFGEDGILQSAGGPLFQIVKADKYDMIPVDTAIERINTGFGWSYPMGTGFAAKGTVATDNAGAPQNSGAASPVAPGTTTTAAVAKVTKAEPSLMQWWTASGEMMLLPAWTFTRDIGGTVQVVAIPDDKVVFPTTVPPAPDTVPGVDELIPAADAQKLVGLAEAEAQKVAEGNGWTWRVTERDGESLPATADYQPRRVDVTVTGGSVTAVTVG